MVSYICLFVCYSCRVRENDRPRRNMSWGGGSAKGERKLLLDTPCMQALCLDSACLCRILERQNDETNIY